MNRPGPRQVFDWTVRRPFLLARRVATRAIERRHGIDTMAEIDLAELGVAGEHRKRYKPTEWRTLRRILPASEVGPDDVFIDFGSGMGRVVFQAAATYRCRRVIGVELSDALNQTARRNLDRTRDRLRCRDVQLVTADVLDYQIPDDVTIAFFANPFTGPIFASVIERLLASVDRSPRKLRIIYRNPVEREFLLGTARLRLVRRLPGRRPTAEWSRLNSTEMYVVVPRGGN